VGVRKWGGLLPRHAPVTDDGDQPSQVSTVASVLRNDRVVRYAAVGAVAWVVLHLVVVLLVRHDEGLLRFVVRIPSLAPMLAATATLTAASVARVRRGARRGAVFWGLLAAGALVWTAGEVIWGGYAYVAGSRSSPSPADACYVGSYLLTIPGLIIAFGRGHQDRRARLLLDAVLLTLSVGVVGWQVLVTPHLSGATDAAGLFAALYPVCDLAVLVCLLTLGLSGQYRITAPLVLVGPGYAVLAMRDGLYTYLAIHGTSANATWANIGYQASWSAIALGGLVAARLFERPTHRDDLERDLTILPVAVGGLAAVGVVLWLPARLGVPPLLVASTATLGLGLLVRQYLTTRDWTTLARRLRDSGVEQERLAVTDSMTDLHNRRFFQETLDLEVARAGRTGEPISVILLDLDRFKRINDTHGHAVGDTVLVQTAERIRATARRGDVVARYGGEEFVWLLPKTAGDAAEVLAERLLVALGGTPMRQTAASTADLWVTGSLGVATEIGVIEGDRLVRSADRALYRAKGLGRNRVEVAVALDGVAMEPMNRSQTPSSPGPVWLADRLAALAGPSITGELVADWSRLVATRLGLTGEIGTLATAARLHALADLSLGDSGQIALLTALTGPGVAALVHGSRQPLDVPAPLGARVIAVCAAWARLGPAGGAGLHTLYAGRGTLYDPAVLDAFRALLDEERIPDHPGPRPGVRRDDASLLVTGG
jgi:two-component system cell cycle response regulator